MSEFNVIVKGQLVAGAQASIVQSNLAKLFKLNGSQAAQLLEGKPRVIRKGVDEATAHKWQAALLKAGLRSEVTEAKSVVHNPHDSGSEDLKMVGTIRTGGEDFIGPYVVAEVGAVLDQKDKETPPPAPNTEHLSVAAAGETIETLKQDITEVSPDISHLSLQD